MRVIEHTDEIFEFLYNLSVGMERLLKIAVVLFEHGQSKTQEELEKSLITHNHQDLIDRIKVHVSLNLGNPHNEFLGILTNFYRSLRYDRFTLATGTRIGRERDVLCGFLSKRLMFLSRGEAGWSEHATKIAIESIFEISSRRSQASFTKSSVTALERLASIPTSCGSTQEPQPCFTAGQICRQRTSSGESSCSFL